MPALHIDNRNHELNMHLLRDDFQVHFLNYEKSLNIF
jgi:hypothetical protein